MRIYVSVTGDLFHYGHINFFKKAREFGKHLTVGVCSDSEVSSYKRRPIMSLDERVAAIEACKYVDDTIPAAPPETTETFIRQHKIDIVVATKAYSSDVLQRYYRDPISLNILRLIDYTDGISSTEIIRRCYSAYKGVNGQLGKL